MIEYLIKGLAWVTFTYSDGTRAIIHTTFNDEILMQYGIVLTKNFLFDVERLQLFKWRDDIQSVDISLEKPSSSDEVEQFESRFI